MQANHNLTNLALSTVAAISVMMVASICSSGCPNPRGVSLALIAVAPPSQQSYVDQTWRWMAVANRVAYAATSQRQRRVGSAEQPASIPIYVTTSTLGERHPAWDKLILTSIIFKHSCAEWVWLLDSDAFIMNMTISIDEVLREATQGMEQMPDVILSRDNHVGQTKRSAWSAWAKYITAMQTVPGPNYG